MNHCDGGSISQSRPSRGGMTRVRPTNEHATANRPDRPRGFGARVGIAEPITLHRILTTSHCAGARPGAPADDLTHVALYYMLHYIALRRRPTRRSSRRSNACCIVLHVTLHHIAQAPDPALQPTIYAARALAVAAASGALAGGGLKLYLDCHAHSARRGVFVYGNLFDDVALQVRRRDANHSMGSTKGTESSTTISSTTSRYRAEPVYRTPFCVLGRPST